MQLFLESLTWFTTNIQILLHPLLMSQCMCSFCIRHIFIQSRDSTSASLFLLLACADRDSWYEENINKVFKQYPKKCQYTQSAGRYIINHRFIQQLASA